MLLRISKFALNEFIRVSFFSKKRPLYFLNEKVFVLIEYPGIDKCVFMDFHSHFTGKILKTLVWSGKVATSLWEVAEFHEATKFDPMKSTR